MQQPIEIYNGTPGSGPNPWKTIFVLEELAVPYSIDWIPYTDIKSEPYIMLNPNGRLPAMVDPNNSVTLFESGAIVEYLTEIYDQDHKISYGSEQLESKWLLRSWLHFQMSAQGPMFGQKMWFTHFHPDKDLKSAIDRYGNECKRIIGVVEAHLLKRKQGGVEDGNLWLVGEKCTYADLVFVSWNLLLPRLFIDGLDMESEYPLYWQWQQRMAARPAIQKAIVLREECLRTMENSAAAVLPERKGSTWE